MTDTPHFDLPFRFDSSGHAAVVEQDTLEDVTNCVEAVLRTIKGQRAEAPDFGIDDPTFTDQPINLQAIVEAVLEQEPRANVLITQSPDKFDSLIADLVADVSLVQEVNAS